MADAYSHAFTAAEAFAVRDELHRVRPLAQLVTAWDHWSHFLHQLRRSDALSADAEDDARHLLAEIAQHLSATSLDFAALGPQATEALWSIPSLLEDLSDSHSSSLNSQLPRLWWSPNDSELALTCLDAASAIGTTLREFGGVVLASATLTPTEAFAAACGLDSNLTQNTKPKAHTPVTTPPPARLGTLNKRQTKKLYTQLTSAAELLRVEEARDAALPALLRAHTPWRDGAYDVAIDARVDTTFQHRSQHYTTTAATIATLSITPNSKPQTTSPSPLRVAVFFPSYAYADVLARELAQIASHVRVALQPRLHDLAAQTAWVETSLASADALFLVLGSSFAEGIDALGGRVSHAMVVGPALPEVNAVQRARLAEFAPLGRDAAFRRVYQIPGMVKVNQALGRLVRAPGQRARVLLHCRRFLEPSYQDLLAPDYRTDAVLRSDADLVAWLSPR